MKPKHVIVIKHGGRVFLRLGQYEDGQWYRGRDGWPLGSASAYPGTWLMYGMGDVKHPLRVTLDGRSIGAITRNDLGTWDESPMVTWTADPPRGSGRMGRASGSAADALDWLVGLANAVAP